MPNPHKYCILGKKANLVGNTFSAYSKSSSNVTPRPFNTRVFSFFFFFLCVCVFWPCFCSNQPCIKATVDCVSIYKACNPNFIYAPSHNPRRVLTKPSGLLIFVQIDGVLNEGHDNQNGDLIIYVNDALGSNDDNKYVLFYVFFVRCSVLTWYHVIDLLGQGTFGQVVKCYSEKFQSHVAVKVIKNKPAYYNQALMEVKILEVVSRKRSLWILIAIIPVPFLLFTLFTPPSSIKKRIPKINTTSSDL